MLRKLSRARFPQRIISSEENARFSVSSINKRQRRSLHNTTIPNPSAASIPAVKQRVEEESLWVRSNKGDCAAVVGYTVPEILRERISGWGHLPAYVRDPE